MAYSWKGENQEKNQSFFHPTKNYLIKICIIFTIYLGDWLIKLHLIKPLQFLNSFIHKYFHPSASQEIDMKLIDMKNFYFL